MSLEKIPDYKVNLDLIMEQWKRSPNLLGIISAALNRGNDMEDAIFEVRDLTNLNTAVGINLDVLGKPWNEFRENRPDEEFRNAIKQKKLEFYSGTPEEIISILKGSYGATFVKYSTGYPGKYRVVGDGTISQRELENISMAGVGSWLAGFIIDVEGNHLIDVADNRLISVID